MSPIVLADGIQIESWWGVIAAVIGLIGGGTGGKYLFDLLRDWWRDRSKSKGEAAEREQQAADRKRQARLEDEDRNYARLEKYCQRLQEELDRLKVEVRRESRRMSKALGWINYIMGRLTEAGIPFEPFRDEPNGNGNGSHSASAGAS